jgi:hypothetical protein
MYSRLLNFSSDLSTILAILVPFHNHGQALPGNLFQGGGTSQICGLYNMNSMVYKGRKSNLEMKREGRGILA